VATLLAAFVILAGLSSASRLFGEPLGVRPVRPAKTYRLDGPNVHKPGGGVAAPILERKVKPRYTPEARRLALEGSVVLEIVVKPDGRVGDVRVIRSLDADHGLDKAAITAVRRWLFTPGRWAGQPVAVQVFAEVSFTLPKPSSTVSEHRSRSISDSEPGLL